MNEFPVGTLCGRSVGGKLFVNIACEYRLRFQEVCRTTFSKHEPIVNPTTKNHEFKVALASNLPRRNFLKKLCGVFRGFLGNLPDFVLSSWGNTAWRLQLLLRFHFANTCEHQTTLYNDILGWNEAREGLLLRSWGGGPLRAGLLSCFCFVISLSWADTKRKMSNYYIYLFATLCACVCLLAIEADCRRLRGKPAFLSVNLGIKKVRHVVECVCCF